MPSDSYWMGTLNPQTQNRFPLQALVKSRREAHTLPVVAGFIKLALDYPRQISLPLTALRKARPCTTEFALRGIDASDAESYYTKSSIEPGFFQS